MADRSNSSRIDTVSDIIKEIDRRLAVGLLKPGQRLVEAELQTSLGVGRVPIREAIRVLAGEGILEIVKEKGARVRTTDSRSVLENVKVLAAITDAAIIDFLDNIDVGQNVEALRQLSDRLLVLVDEGDSDRVMRAIEKYHWKIAIFSGNAVLSETLRKMRLTLYREALIRAAGGEAVIRCGRRYTALTDALARNERVEAMELVGFLRDTIISAIKRNLLSAQAS